MFEHNNSIADLNINSFNIYSFLRSSFDDLLYNDKLSNDKLREIYDKLEEIKNRIREGDLSKFKGIQDVEGRILTLQYIFITESDAYGKKKLSEEFNESETKDVFKGLEKAADMGYAWAQNLLGEYYFLNHSDLKLTDLSSDQSAMDLAMSWFNKAIANPSDEGTPNPREEAMGHLAKIYISSEKIAEAAELYVSLYSKRLSSDQLAAYSCSNKISKLCKDKDVFNRSDMFEVCRKIADLGYVPAQCALAERYLVGNGVVANTNRAKVLYEGILRGENTVFFASDQNKEMTNQYISTRLQSLSSSFVDEPDVMELAEREVNERTPLLGASAASVASTRRISGSRESRV